MDHWRPSLPGYRPAPPQKGISPPDPWAHSRMVSRDSHFKGRINGDFHEHLVTDRGWQGREYLTKELPKSPRGAVRDPKRRPGSAIRWVKRLEHRGWTWEALALLVGLSCQVAIAAILIVMHDQPLDRWTAAVSINAVVATLTTTAKSMTLLSVGSCMSQLKWVYFKTRARPLALLDLFEETGKGPLGAVKMLFKVRAWLPLLGAATMLLALAVDAFAQQIITLESQDVPRYDSSVSFRITHNYSASAQANGEDGPLGVDLGNAGDVAMQGAVMRGLYGIPTTPQFNCSSKCNWSGSYLSLGFETTCQNVTQAVLNTRKCRTGDVDSQTIQVCNMTTPGNLSLSTYLDPTNWQTTVDVATRNLWNFSGPFSPDFLQLAVLRVPNQYNSNDGSSDMIGEEAVECTMRLSGWEYTNMSATGNILNVEQTTNVPLGDGSYGAKPFITFATQSDPPQNLTIRDVDWLGIISYLLSPAFTGNLTVGMLSSPANNGIRLPFASGNMTTTLDNLAQSMTDYIRSGPNSQMVNGQLLQSVLFVRVQAAWLALPLFIQLAAIDLLLFTAIQSRGSKGMPLWKSSSMALLFAHYEQKDGLIRTAKESPEDLDDFSENVTVKAS